MEAVKAGGDRQQLHELIREQSLLAWQALQEGQPNPLADNLLADRRISALVPPDKARGLLEASAYVGDAAAAGQKHRGPNSRRNRLRWLASFSLPTPDSPTWPWRNLDRDSLSGHPLAELAPGVWLVDCDEGFWGLAETWIDSPPIFVRHICPVDSCDPPHRHHPETCPASAKQP